MEKNVFEERELPKLKKDKMEKDSNKKDNNQGISKGTTKNSNNRNNKNSSKKETNKNSNRAKTSINKTTKNMSNIDSKINDIDKNNAKSLARSDRTIKSNTKNISDNRENLKKPNKNNDVEENEKELTTEHVKLDDILERLAEERKKEQEAKMAQNNKKKKPKNKLKLRKWIWLVLLIVCLGTLTFSLSRIYIWYQENKRVDSQMEEIDKITDIKEVNEDDENIQIENVNPPKKENKDNDYWNYIKLPLISVDFNELLAKNKDTVAYLKVNGTNINYPVVQTNDNKYYLTHAFDKTYNSAGWVFMDYRNDANNLQDNTIIYAHGRVNTTMFGSLKNVFKSNWYANTDNYVINLSTPKENTLWQVISVYQIPTETYYLTSSFGTKESKQKFINTILSRSKYNFKADVTVDDKILTLSTCANKTEKVVLHAKLIKKQIR